jgi:hypothetical protein
MKTKDLFKIVVAAQAYREKSYDEIQNKYLFSLEEAIDSCITFHSIFVDDENTPTYAERELALFLIRNAWNEVQDWAKE